MRLRSCGGVGLRRITSTSKPARSATNSTRVGPGRRLQIGERRAQRRLRDRRRSARPRARENAPADRLRSDFFLRMAASTSVVRRYSAVRVGVFPPAASSTSASVGHGAAWTLPACHHDHTSSVDKRQVRREQPLQHATGRRSMRGVRRSGRGLAEIAVAARLHQLEVVVAEIPEERLGVLQHPRVVVVVLEPLGRLAHEAGEIRQQPDVERMGDRARAARCARARTSRR